LLQSCSFWLNYAPNCLAAGASNQTPLGELRALPILLAGKGREKERKGGKRTAGKEGKGEVDP